MESHAFSPGRNGPKHLRILADATGIRTAELTTSLQQVTWRGLPIGGSAITHSVCDNTSVSLRRSSLNRQFCCSTNQGQTTLFGSGAHGETLDMAEYDRTPPKTRRVIALVVGCLLLLPALAAFLGGGALALGYAFGRDDAGYFRTNLDRIESPTVAVTTEKVDLIADTGEVSRVIDSLDADVRVRVANARSADAVFIGIASQADVDRYLSGVAHDEVREVRGHRPVYRTRAGGNEVTAPTAEDFWVARASGMGSQELLWRVRSGRWVAVVMNADGSPGVAADVEVGAKAGFVLPLALILLGLGVIATAGSVALIVFGAHGFGRHRDDSVAPSPPADASLSAGPVRLEAHLDNDLSRWLWLVKWFLAIPHFVVLVFLWLAFLVLTIVAWFSILFTGRYPRRIFEFNVGVMRWSWRVSYYATTGGIGTDRYPPFSLHPDPTYPASLDIEPPAQLSRGLALVKWWLLAIPHYLIIGLFAGGTSWASSSDDSLRVGSGGGGGLLGLLVVIAGVILLFRGRYQRSLFDLIVGLNRWIFRVIAYAALMTDAYPPFRLDQGGSEPAARTDGEPGEPIAATTDGVGR